MVDMELIGIAGRKQHGKDTAAKALLERGFENVKFAGALKAMVSAFLAYVGYDEETIERIVNGDLKETPLACFGGKTSRDVQQTLGTEWGRQMVWDRIWINAFDLRADQHEKVACTDMRFPNEVAHVKERGGTTVRVFNPNAPRTGNDDHISESQIDTLPVDHVLINDGTIAELHAKVLLLTDINDAEFLA
jgi:hypothetical protein